MQRWDKHREKKEQRLSALRDKSTGATNAVPLELLAQDWLTEQQPSNELRAYLVDNLLPCVVVGLEKLLTEVSAQGLMEDKEENPDFNPVNYLAQQLMRTNPSHSTAAQTHSYCTAMKVVSEKLRNVALTADTSEDLEGLKSHIRKLRLERESAELAVAMETQRREELLRGACSKWSLPGKSGGINSAEVGFAVHSWLEKMSSHPLSSSLSSFSAPLPRDSRGLLSEECLVSALLERGAGVSGELVDDLSHHLTLCGVERLRRVHRDHRQTLLTGVFESCDPDKTGFVDRSRMLHLFNCFYNSASGEVQEKLHNPRKWPVVEVLEAEELEDDEERRSASLSVTSLTDQDYQEFLTGHPGRISPSHASNDNTGEVSKEPSSSPDEQRPEEDSPVLDKVASESTVDKKAEEKGSKEGGDRSSPEVGRRIPPLKSRASSVIDKRLATAGVYGQSGPISAQRRLSGMAHNLVSPSGPGSTWDHFLLTCSQFVQLVELFLTSPGPSVPDPVLEALAAFIHDNYTETAQERSERLELAEQQRLIFTRRQRVNSLFEVWDNDGSGYLELEELQLVLGRWKNFSSEQAQEQAREILVSLGVSRLSRAAFQVYIEGLTEDMDLAEFEEFADYLLTSVKLTFEDVRRGEVRRGLLERIALAGKASGLRFSTALKTAVQALEEDSEQFGGGKSCSSAMAVLDRGANALVFKAASSEVSARVVTRKLLRSFKQVSFKAVDSARPVCVTNIRKHGDVYFFLPEHNQEEFNGSLVVAPIVTPREEVVGVVSVDSLREVAEDGLDTTFSTHEINFYQGVGVCLGEVHHWIEARRKLLTVSQSALSWIHRRCPQVSQSGLYIVEPSPGQEPCSLRCMLTTSGPSTLTTTNNLLTREDNIFRDYLFQCADISEAVVATAYGQHHLAYPIRDSSGCAVAVLDLYMPPTQELRPSQTREVTKVLKLLTLAYYKLSCVSERPATTGGESSSRSGCGVRLTDDHVSVLFDQLMLTDLKRSVSKLDNRVFAEMRSYVDPSPTILHTVQSLLYILHPDTDFDTWAKCKQLITASLLKDLQEFDPLSLEEQPHKRLDLVKQIASGIGSVEGQGSVPARYIYSWVSVCLSLLEHVASSRQCEPSTTSSSQGRPTPPSTSATVSNLQN